MSWASHTFQMQANRCKVHKLKCLVDYFNAVHMSHFQLATEIYAKLEEQEEGFKVRFKARDTSI